MYKSSVTIEEIYRLALPMGSRLLAGATVLDRTVSWACSLRPSPPAFPKLDGDELALVDMEDLHRLGSHMNLEKVVRTLQPARIAGLAVLGEVSEAAIRSAEAGRIPLFQLPATQPLVQVERAIIRLIVDRGGYVAQRSGELQRELNQIALDGGGFACIATHVQRFAQGPLVLLRDDGQLLAQAGLEHLSEGQRQMLLEQLPNLTELRSWAAMQSGQKTTGVVGTLRLAPAAAALGYAEAALAAVYPAEAVRGYCLLLRPQTTAGKGISSVEEIAITQAASAVAMEWAKQNAIGIVEERMRAAFVDDLLASEIADEQAWIQRGSSLHYDLTKPHVAWMVEARNVPEWPAPLLRLIHDQGGNVPYSRREEGILLYWPHNDPKSGRAFKPLAHTFAERIRTQHPKASLIIGIGRPAVGPAMWLQSQQQARESWRMGKEWKAAPVTYFGDLGLYQLLTTFGGNAEAARFYRKTLGRLLSHDANKNSELVETLEAFFTCHGNLSQTAAELHIHRNTLTYRLDQIALITQLDLNDADARFSLQFALKLRPVVRV